MKVGACVDWGDCCDFLGGETEVGVGSGGIKILVLAEAGVDFTFHR